MKSEGAVCGVEHVQTAKTTQVQKPQSARSSPDSRFVVSEDHIKELKRQLAEIRAKLDGLINTESWDCEEVPPADATTTQAVDCVI